MGDLLKSLLLAAVGTAFFVVKAYPWFLGVALLERFGPVYGSRPPLSAHFKGLLFQLIGVCLGAIVTSLLWRWLPWPRPLWPALAFPLALLIGDFLHYWEHRFEHRFLWRMHAIHHSTRQMSGLSGFHHFTDGAVFSVVRGVPLALLTNDPLGLAYMGLFMLVYGAFTHSPTKLSIGPLRYLIFDNRMHRIHHSIEERHFDRNFGAIFTVWDVIFRTAYWPARGEWPETGIREHGEIERILDFLVRPALRSSN